MAKHYPPEGVFDGYRYLVFTTKVEEPSAYDEGYDFGDRWTREWATGRELFELAAYHVIPETAFEFFRQMDVEYRVEYGDGVDYWLGFARGALDAIRAEDLLKD